MTTPVRELLATVNSLWPDSVNTSIGRSKGLKGFRGPGLVLIPNARHPRLLVPAENSKAAAAAMLRFSSGLSASDVVKRLSASAALRVAPASFRDHIHIEEVGDSITRYLAAVLGCKISVSLGIGPARANRKPVLEVFDERGRSIAYAKIGDSVVAQRDVKGEAAALTAISGHLDGFLQVPTVLHTGTWRESFVLVMSSLATSPRQNPRRQWDVPHETMSLLSEAFGEASQPLTETQIWHRMIASVDQLRDVALQEDLRDALRRLGERSVGQRMRVGAWHGDWTPWNMSRHGTKVQLWDWERFETGVPVGFDAVHYAINATVRQKGESLDAVYAGMRLSSLSRESAVLGAYLAAITCRYAASAEDELGHLISRRAHLMRDALEGWLEHNDHGISRC